jgi:hypothetical protein
MKMCLYLSLGVAFATIFDAIDTSYLAVRTPLPVSKMMEEMVFSATHTHEEYRGKNKLLVIDIKDNVIRHSALSSIIWYQRGVELITSLLKHAAISPLPDATFGAYLHDGCMLSSGLYMSLSSNKQHCRMALPLPVTPTCHNPFWFKNRSINRLHSHLTKTYPWDSKQPEAFWRGGPTDGTRKADLLAEMSLRAPHLSANRARSVLLSLLYPSALNSRLSVNTRMDKNQSMESDGARIKIDSLGGTSNMVAFTDFFKYKFLLDLDGAGSSFRLPSLMVGNSVVLRPDTFSYWWHDAFKGATVTVADDLGDIVAIINQLQQNDTLAKSYAEKATAALQKGAFSVSHEREVWNEVLAFFPHQVYSGLHAANLTECVLINSGCSCRP